MKKKYDFEKIEYEHMPISYRMALDTGEFEFKDGYLRPDTDSYLADHFNHSEEHNGQSFVLPANENQKDALVIGGSRYTLLEFSEYCQ